MSDPIAVYTVESVKLTITTSNPPELQITATGTVPSQGYTNPELVKIVYHVPPPDGIYEYVFEATPPKAVYPATSTPIEASTVRSSIPADMQVIGVIAQTNTVYVPLREPTAAAV